MDHLIIWREHAETTQDCVSAKRLCKEKKSKNPRLLWKWVGGSRIHSEFFFIGKSSQNSPKPVGS